MNTISFVVEDDCILVRDGDEVYTISIEGLSEEEIAREIEAIILKGEYQQ